MNQEYIQYDHCDELSISFDAILILSQTFSIFFFLQVRSHATSVNSAFLAPPPKKVFHFCGNIYPHQ